MVKFFAIMLLFVSFSSNANTLAGKWEINIEKTLAFSEKNIKLDPIFESIFKCSILNTNLVFESNEYSLNIKGHECINNEKKSYIDAVYEKYKYKLVFESSKQTVIELSRHNNKRYDIINWINDREFWLDQGDEESIVRYFYKKATDKK